LIEGDETGAVLKPAGNSPRVRMTASRHGGDNDGSKMLVELVRRDDQTRPRLAHFTSDGRIKPDEVHVAPLDWTAL
jgi:hypothetical protein